MSNQRTRTENQLREVVGLLLLVVLLPLLLPLMIVAFALFLLSGVFLHLAVWCCWCVRGRYVLFVYSDSPIWHEYIQEHMLPRLGQRAVILNWSDRRRWRRTLAVLVFRYFGYSGNFNPMAVVFRPLRLTRLFRFYEPFREFKHGQTDAVVKMERELFDLVDNITETQIA